MTVIPCLGASSRLVPKHASTGLAIVIQADVQDWCAVDPAAFRDRRPSPLEGRTDRGIKVVGVVALANKTARMVWALMTGGERYREPTIA